MKKLINSLILLELFIQNTVYADVITPQILEALENQKLPIGVSGRGHRIGYDFNEKEFGAYMVIILLGFIIVLSIITSIMKKKNYNKKAIRITQISFLVAYIICVLVLFLIALNFVRSHY